MLRLSARSFFQSFSRIPQNTRSSLRLFSTEVLLPSSSFTVPDAKEWEILSANKLRQAFASGKLVSLPSFPQEFQTCTDAAAKTAGERIQDLVMSGLHMQPIGWKVGATSAKAQQHLGIDTPFLGPIFLENSFDSPANIVASGGRWVRGVEAEFGFEMKYTLVPRGPTGRPYTDLEVAAAVRKLIPTVEVVATRFDHFQKAQPGKLPLLAVLADLGNAHAVVKSNHQYKEWQDMDLANTKVTIKVNGELKVTGFGSEVMGHPIKALTWTVNHLSQRNIALPKEFFVSTGTCTGVVPVCVGDQVVADFEGLGQVELTVE